MIATEWAHELSCARLSSNPATTKLDGGNHHEKNG